MSEEEFAILTAEIERLTVENFELRGHVDWLLRERMDVASLEREARKPMAQKIKMTLRQDD